jgi:hypothetical protein
MIDVRVGDLFELEYEREDGSISRNLLPFVQLDGETWLVRDYAPYLHITPEELTADLNAQQLRGHKGILRRVRIGSL